MTGFPWASVAASSESLPSVSVSCTEYTVHFARLSISDSTSPLSTRSLVNAWVGSKWRRFSAASSWLGHQAVHEVEQVLELPALSHGCREVDVHVVPGQVDVLVPRRPRPDRGESRRRSPRGSGRPRRGTRRTGDCGPGVPPCGSSRRLPGGRGARPRSPPRSARLRTPASRAPDRASASGQAAREETCIAPPSATTSPAEM